MNNEPCEREKELMERLSDDLLENRKPKLPHMDYVDGIRKENAWIVWICDSNQRVTDLMVYELNKELPTQSAKIIEFVERSMGTTPIKDCGCVNSDWDEWSISDVLFKFGWQYGFSDRSVMIKCIKRLSLINEFENQMLKWLSFV